MTVTTKNILPSKYLENTQTAQYTSSSKKTVIDKAVVSNVSASNVKFNCHIVQSGTSASAANKLIVDQIIVPGESYLCPEITGQVLESGDYISTLASASSALVINLSGRQMT